MKRFDKQLTAIIILVSYKIVNVKKYGVRGRGAQDLEVWYTSSKFYSDITYYFWLSTSSNLRATSNPYIIELISLEFLV